MKALINKIFLFSFCSLVFLSCKKDEQQAVYSGEAEAPVVAASTTNVVLSKANVGDTVVTFTWQPAGFGFQAAVSYSLELDVKGGNFENPRTVKINEAGVLEKDYNGMDFNSILLSMNLPEGSASDIQVRIKAEAATLGTVTNPAVSIAPVYSAPVELTVTPFALISYIYVPGAYQGWDPASADSLTSPSGNGIYEGVIYFDAADSEFKLTKGKNWNDNYGGSDGRLESNGSNLKVPAAGNYLIKADLNALTYEVSPLQWSIIGSATAGDWAADTDMKYHNGKRVWEITASLTAGELKFRKNHDWGTNFGDSDPKDGSLDAGGDNIPVASAGTYKITLNLNENTYSIQKL